MDIVNNKNDLIEDFSVDIVYLWCDSTDNNWVEKKNNELKKYGKDLDNDSTGECRFIDNDELKYSLRSLEKYAPWINNIFIVTDNQVPEWLDTSNPKIHIVDHSEILPAEALPTFNSIAIETALHKIPGLSEHFLYANDDMFFGRSVEKSFFFDKNGIPLFRFSKRNIINKIYRHIYGYTIFSAYNSVKKRFGESFAHFPHHNIDAYRKSDIEKCYQDYKENFEKTVRQKFRQKDCVQRSIFGYYAIANGAGNYKVVDNLTERFRVYLKSSGIDSMPVELKKSKIKLIDKYKPCLFCFNDSLKTNNEDRIAMKNYLAKRFSKPSSFEKISKKILVTGGAGYIGSHNAAALLDEGYDIVIFDNLELGHLETVETLKNINTAGKVVDFIKGDLQNYDDINSVFMKHKIDAVIHFAAYSQVAESVKNPQKYYFNNVYGTLNLLRAMLENNVKNIVFSSTAATYGEPVYVPIDENHPQNPINTYGKTKLMIENIMDDYDRAYGLKSVRLRYFNVAGADNQNRVGEWHDPETHLIPNILKSTFSGGKTFQMFGTDYETKDGTCVRDYINVEDLAKAHIFALKYLEQDGETNFFNLGTNEGNSVKEVFNICEKVTGKQIPVEIKGRRDGDPAVLIADNKKVNEILGWVPEKTLDESIITAYNWEKTLIDKMVKK